jgi:hypothetical protein
MQLTELKLTDQALFEKYLKTNEYHLSAYHFCNIFIWRRIYRIVYTILDGCLCVFFRDRDGCFMYLPPLGRDLNLSVIDRCFAIMDDSNPNKEISRIENVDEKYLDVYKKHGYTYSIKPGDYLYKREDIVSLRGNRFKSKRASYNYFVKHNDFRSRPFHKRDMTGCLCLYRSWVRQRKNKFSDLVYQGMLEDNFLCQEVAMENFLKLGLTGYIIKIQDVIAGYTFGFPLNPTTFCILFEICDLDYKGISQFIFSEFCRQLADYQYINIMDDSGLLNLRKVKLSYRPIKIIENYIINRRDCG